MNRIATFLILSLASYPAAAQITGIRSPLLKDDNRGRKLQRAILAAQAGQQGSLKTAALKSRLIATSQYSTVALADTTRYFYSGYRGSQKTIQPAYLLTYFSLPQDGHPVISADSELNWNSNHPLNKFSFDHRAVNEFDGADRVISRTYHRYDGYRQYYKDDYAYDPTGFLSKTLHSDTLNVPGGALIPKQDIHYQYNSQNKIIYDSTWNVVDKNPFTKTHYFYDGKGNQTMSRFYTWNASTSRWDIADSIVMTYNAGNLMTNLVFYGFNNGAVDYGFRDTFGYTNNQPLYTYLEDEEMNTINVWEKYYLEQNHLVPAGNDYDTMQSSTYDPSKSAYVPDDRTFALFNQDGTLHEAHIFTWNGGPSPQLNSIRYYYYEQYNDLTSASGPVNDLTISVSPNPVTGATYKLDLEHFPVDSKFRVHLINSMGQLVSVQSCTGGKINAVSMQGISPGIYLLWLQDRQGKTVYQGRLERR